MRVPAYSASLYPADSTRRVTKLLVDPPAPLPQHYPQEKPSAHPLAQRGRLLSALVDEVDPGGPPGQHAAGVRRRAAVADEDHGGHDPDLTGRSGSGLTR